MLRETITARDDLIVRRLVLEPGEATHWHRDLCRRFTVVVRGEKLRIEHRDGGPDVFVATPPGAADWDEPTDRVHRGVNAGASTYEEVVIFFLGAPGLEPQPEA
jgi:hypothetical protein